MGSGSHIQGIPQRPGLVSSRGALAVREHDRERTADNREAIYVRPLGRGYHLVRNPCNDQAYRVGSAIGVTHTPGSKVMLSSNTGHPGEIIIGEPPPDKRGASSYGTSVVLGSMRAGVTAASGDYIGIGIEASGTLAAYRYRNGTVGARIAIKEVSYAGTVNNACLISYSPLAVLFDCDGDLHVWNITTNTLYDFTSPTATPFCYGGDGYAYLADHDGDEMFRLYQIGPTATINDLSGTPDTLVAPIDGDLINFLLFDGTAAFMVVQDSGGIGTENGDSGIVKLVSGERPVFVSNTTFLPDSPAVWGNLVHEGHRFASQAITVGSPVDDDLTLLTSAPSSTIALAAVAAQFDLRSWYPNQLGNGVCLYGADGVAFVSGAALVAHTAPTFFPVDDMPDGPGQPSFMLAV